MFRRILLALSGLAVIGGGGFLWYSWWPEIPAIAVPAPATFSAEQIERGRVVAAEGYCAECHTRTDKGGGPRLAGDFKMATPFGDIFSANITPDPETGIGQWSEDAFRRAMQFGVDRNGRHLFPAFVYDHFTKMSDQDISDLYAWLMTRPPEKLTPRENGFPLNIMPRPVLAGWKLLFFKPGRYTPDPTHDEQWNRGAYLAEGVAHCGSCHTPRNIFGAEKRHNTYDGGIADGWIAPPLNATNPAPIAWTEEELFQYLRHGTTPLHGSASGVMSSIIHEFLSQAPESDVRAIAHYFAWVSQAEKRDSRDTEKLTAVMRSSGKDLTGAGTDPEARLYHDACASCHYNTAPSPVPGRPELGLSTALWLPEPTNLYLVMLHGVTSKEGQKGVVMPSFYDALSDHDMARIAAYLRRTRTTLPPWKNPEQKVAEARKLVGKSPVNASN